MNEFNFSNNGAVVERPVRVKEGLKDGPKYHFRCTCCGKDLLDAHVTRPDCDIDAIYKCRCPWCHNYSNEHRIKGGFHAIGQAELDQHGKEKITTMPNGDFETLSDGTVIIPINKQ